MWLSSPSPGQSSISRPAILPRLIPQPASTPSPAAASLPLAEVSPPPQFQQEPISSLLPLSLRHTIRFSAVSPLLPAPIPKIPASCPSSDFPPTQLSFTTEPSILTI